MAAKKRKARRAKKANGQPKIEAPIVHLSGASRKQQAGPDPIVDFDIEQVRGFFRGWSVVAKVNGNTFIRNVAFCHDRHSAETIVNSLKLAQTLSKASGVSFNPESVATTDQ